MEIVTYTSATAVSAAKKSAVALFFPILLTAGTGGALTAQNARAMTEFLSIPQIRVQEPLRKDVDIRTPAEQVAFIRESLGLNMSELASLLSVARPTAYAWLSGQEPQLESLLQIHRLVKVAETVVSMGMSGMDKLLRRPVVDGRSTLDNLKAAEDITADLFRLQEVAAKESKARKAFKGTGKKVGLASGGSFTKTYSEEA